MSERTVAEIIGWTPKAIEGRTWWVPPSWVHTSVAASTPQAAEVDCDDMLAWLVSRDEHDGIETWSDQGGHVVKLWLSMQSWPEEHHGGSLHAALEAAVRAVAEAGDE